MKKNIIIGMVAVLATTGAMAQNDDIMVPKSQEKTGTTFTTDQSKAQFSADLALLTAQVWRGQVLNNDFVFQPQFTVRQYGVFFNIVANYDLNKNYQGNSGSFSEIDFSLGYVLPFDLNDLEFEVGLINYNYTGTMNQESTSELYGKASLTTFYKEDSFSVLPSVTLYGDIAEVDGVYMLFDIHASYPVMDKLTAEAGVSAGWGSTSYNSYYWDPSADSAWNDYNFYSTIYYNLMDNLQLSLNLTYTMLEGGAIRDGASVYESDNKVWGGFNVKYVF